MNIENVVMPWSKASIASTIVPSANTCLGITTCPSQRVTRLRYLPLSDLSAMRSPVLSVTFDNVVTGHLEELLHADRPVLVDHPESLVASDREHRLSFANLLPVRRLDASKDTTLGIDARDGRH